MTEINIGDYKIKKIDPINWSIFVKTDAPSYNKDIYRTDKRTGKTYVSNKGGYRSYGPGYYFYSLENACIWFLEHIALNDIDADNLNKIIEAINEAKEDIISAINTKE